MHVMRKKPNLKKNRVLHMSMTQPATTVVPDVGIR